jgi:hypothetical protein|tara:strand:- start:403 stop:630 length:228 start_codon:yes stop_codon:yes gene_type:complete
MPSSTLNIHGVKAVLIEHFDYPGASGVYLHIKSDDGQETQITCFNTKEIPVMKISPKPGEIAWDVRDKAFKQVGC